MKIADIKISDRYRKVLGDLRGLADSIQSVGLLHPPVVDGSGKLIVGERRVAAAKLLGWSEIPVTVAKDINDVVKAAMAERDENTCREPLELLEKAALGRVIEAVEKPKAAERQVEGQNRGRMAVHGKLPGTVPKPETQETRQKVANALGMGARTYDKLKAVDEAARKEPEKFAAVADEMNKSGNVSRAHRKVVEIRKPKRAAKPPAPPPVSEFVTIPRAALEDCKAKWAILNGHIGKHFTLWSYLNIKLEAKQMNAAFSAISKS